MNKRLNRHMAPEARGKLKLSLNVIR
jgi:hypothetical protein